MLEGVVDGKETLTIAFRGTASLFNTGDVSHWPAFDAYFASFLPLIDALGPYARAHGIEQVLVTGHSLGGAMVQDFLATPIAGISPDIERGYTWGSPGADLLPTNAQLVNFEHPTDPILLARFASVLGVHYDRVGTDIFLDSALLGSPTDPTSPVAHNPENYLADTSLLVERANDQSSAFYTEPEASALRSGDL